MGPVAHLGIPVSVAHTLRLNLLVTGFCAFLPDIVDKTLYIFGIGNGRYVGHSLLFIFLITVAFSLKNKMYGWSALLGGISHLLLDLPVVPWFFPFVNYDFSELTEYSFSEILRNYVFNFTFGKEFFLIVLVWLVILIYQRLSLWLTKRQR